MAHRHYPLPNGPYLSPTEKLQFCHCGYWRVNLDTGLTISAGVWKEPPAPTESGIDRGQQLGMFGLPRAEQEH